MTTILTYLGALVALFLCLAALRRQGAEDLRDALSDLPNVSNADKSAALACFARAEQADAKTIWYDLSAPLVMLLVLPLVKRSANKLPRLFSKWDNNISLNGDAHAVYRDDQWLDLRDGVEALPGEHVYSYDDELYAGDAYYAKGHHPRSFWARYIWVGLRNRASQLSVDHGVNVHARPVLISGDVRINRSSRPGYFLLKDGDSYHFKSIEKVRILGLQWALIRSYGYKLEIALMRPDDQLGTVAAVAIGWSLKKWQAA